MAKDKIDRLEEKKMKLKAELKNIQHELDESFDGVKNEVSSKLDPTEFIKKHPLEIVAASVFIGFLVGHTDQNKHSSSGSSSDQGFTSTLWYELKRLVTKKAISTATEQAEKFLKKKKDEIIPSENGSGEV